MSSSGYLVPPSKNPAQEKLWVETWKRIDRFLPDLKNELALDEPEPAPAPAEEKPAEAVAEATEPAEFVKTAEAAETIEAAEKEPEAAAAA
jgi:golgi-specific brefeldin A-resistance guanine nucleotide exchange factor 1